LGRAEAVDFLFGKPERSDLIELDGFEPALPDAVPNEFLWALVICVAPEMTVPTNSNGEIPKVSRARRSQS
jgi:hypothetical protein